MTTGVKGDRSTAQAPQLSVSTEASSNSGRAPLILRIKRTGLPGSCCGYVSELVFPSMQDGFQATINGCKPTRLLISGKEEADVQETNTGECALLAEEKSGASTATLEKTLEVDSIFHHSIPQQNTVQQAGSTTPGAPVVQKKKFRYHQDHTYCKIRPQESLIPGHVESCETKSRKRKQANPCRIVPCEVKTQPLHVQQPGHQGISRSGLETQPGDSSNHVASCETQRRRRKQASPRHVMVDADGGIWVSESYCGATLKPHATLFDVDTVNVNTVQQAGSTTQRAPVVQKKKVRDHQDHTYCKVYIQPSAITGHVESCESNGRRKKQVNPCCIVRHEVQTQAQHVKQPSHQSISTPVHTQASGITGHVESCETKSGPSCQIQARRCKQSSPRHVMVDADGRVWISESYGSPTLKPHPPVTDVDFSEEPMPGQPERKRARR
ncbi:uncharacterized protein LOC134460783 isoform X2 [Engraulis encrasicolus]